MTLDRNFSCARWSLLLDTEVATGGSPDGEADIDSRGEQWIADSGFSCSA